MCVYYVLEQKKYPFSEYCIYDMVNYDRLGRSFSVFMHSSKDRWKFINVLFHKYYLLSMLPPSGLIHLISDSFFF